jgi:hypothetical protein
MTIVGFRPDPDRRAFMTFRLIPTSAEAQELVEIIASEILASETRQRQRRASDLANFKDCLGRLLGDLAVTLHRDLDTYPQFGQHYRDFPRYHDFYAKQSVPVSRTHAIAAYDGLKRLGFIVSIIKGYKLANGEGACEVIAPTDRLRQRMAHLTNDPALHWGQAHRVPVDGPSDFRPAIVVTRKVRENGRVVNASDLVKDFAGLLATNEGQRITQEQEARNEFIRSVTIEGFELDGWQRRFFDDWAHGGQLFAKVPAGATSTVPSGATSYQNYKKAERTGIRFNGLPVNEIDLRASYLFFALAKRSVSLRERMRQLGISDPYGISPEFSRELVKKYVAAAFGQGQHPTKWPRGSKAELGIDKLPKIGAVRAAVLTVYPELTDLTGLNWATLSKVESDVICQSMDWLRGRGVPACPIYDCLMVPVESTTLAMMYLARACREIVGFVPPEPKIVRNYASNPQPNAVAASALTIAVERPWRPAV